MTATHRHRLCVASAAIAMSFASAAPAQESSLPVRALAATCAACHGTDGRAIEGAAVPGLAGMPQGTLAEQMNAFKNGARPATLMHQIAKGYSPAQIEQLAAYFAAQKK
jgi:cytochrome c553